MITEIVDYLTGGCGRCDRFETPECFTKVWDIGQAGLRRLSMAAGLTEARIARVPVHIFAGEGALELWEGFLR